MIDQLALPISTCRVCGETTPREVCQPCARSVIERIEANRREEGVGAAVKQADFDRKAIARRIHDLAHDCPAEGCQTCIQAGY